MSSDKQILANQRNAQLSTGPRTSQGKEISRYNGLRHGFRTEIPLMPDEDAEDYRRFADALNSDLRPSGSLELEIADRIVSQAWRLRRVARIETGILLWEFHAERLAGLESAWTDSAAFYARLSEDGRATLEDVQQARKKGAPAIGRAFARGASAGDTLSKLSRYEMRLSRNLIRDVMLLRHLQRSP